MRHLCRVVPCALHALTKSLQGSRQGQVEAIHQGAQGGEAQEGLGHTEMRRIHETSRPVAQWPSGPVATTVQIPQ